MRDRIRQYIVQQVQEAASRKNIHLGEIGEHFNLLGSGVCDSLELVELITDTEERFGVKADLSDADPERFTEVGGLVDALLLGVGAP